MSATIPTDRERPRHGLPEGRLAIGGPSARRHALVRQLLDRSLVLRQMRQTHATQHIWCFGELNVGVADDLDSIAPRVQEIEKRAGQDLDASVGQRLADGLLVIDDQSKMTASVGGLRTALLERNELVTQIDERCCIALASQFEVEEATVESQRSVNVADLQSDMIETHGARFLRCR